MTKRSESIENLFRKLTVSKQEPSPSESTTTPREHPPYLFLLQHSNAAHLRHAAAQGTLEDTLYHRAGLRTPAENATRDCQAGTLWMRHVGTTLQKTVPRLIWVQTTSISGSQDKRNERASRITPNQTTVIDLSVDPWGWNDSDALNLNCLETLLRVLKEKVAAQKDTNSSVLGTIDDYSNYCVPIMFDSISPLLVRHGFDRILNFLTLVSRIPTVCPLVVPIRTDSLTSAQHCRLEDASHAVLWLTGGEAVLLRQGVRERGNVLREALSYQIVTDRRNGLQTIRVLEHEEASLPRTDGDDDVENNVNAGRGPVKGSSRSSERPKIKLQLEDDDAISAKETPSITNTTSQRARAPQIIVQDDDPEFDDYDEEDPDDDLDI
ncbi:predicted protein [Phaeodactylum tricornutum CCAP 1055/1]|uniref:Elongator complex protein 5 n=1 Tax=Phaeodactylum tricornutum (strain CCAP 1055/1) TaxID=556484 RepID=B7FVH2_PHATC|nr:predicted protein [Phaeodactylum tricornutum CCAP 1055/1]EEC49629.1 predicted protein [Phaeodactylum tricornutum CCAP 1055/1]|eukprot:XP_002178931.1 predicted protein [Phaeodactylum tricornutum CCAP 1055/1]